MTPFRDSLSMLVQHNPQHSDKTHNTVTHTQYFNVDSVYAVALSGTVAVTGGGDDRAFLWDITSGEKKAELKGHGDSVVAVDFNFDGKYVATGGLDALIKIWDVSNGELVQTLDGPSEGIEVISIRVWCVLCPRVSACAWVLRYSC